MANTLLRQDDSAGDLRALINADAAELSSGLRAQQVRDFPPAAQKTIRRFSPGEAARFLGIAEGYLRQLVSEGKGPPPQSNNRRTYSIEDIDGLRADLDKSSKGRRYLPHRKNGESHISVSWAVCPSAAFLIT